MGEVAFSQQGAVNWDQLGSNGITYAVNVAGRLSAKGIDTYTISVGSIGIGGLFSLSEKGQARVEEALAKATCFESFSKLLYFGVGIEHVNRQLAKTVQGMNFLVLANSLTEIFDIDTSARIMREIFKQAAPEERIHPALRQWTALLKSTAGLLARTSFARIVEQFMAYYDPAGHKDGRKRRNGEEADIAHALLLLFKIGRDDNRLTRVNLKGGATCGFIAAFGYYFLGLEVEIWEPRRKKVRKLRQPERQILFRSCSFEKSVNIIVEFEYQWRSSSLGSPRDSTPQLALSNKAAVESTSFIVSDIYDMIRDGRPYGAARRARDGLTQPTLGGRIPWSSLLSEGFPKAGALFLEHGKRFSSFLGSTAKILEFAAQHNESSQQFQVRLSPEQYGQRFVDSAMVYFPELKEFEKDMRHGYNCPVMMALNQYQKTAFFFEQKLKESETCSTIATHYLLVFLVYAFSSMVIPEGLYPTRGGIQSLRFRVFSRRYEPEVPGSDLESNSDFEGRSSGRTAVSLPEISFYTAPKSPNLRAQTVHLKWHMIDILEPRAVMYSAACLFGNAAPATFGGGYENAVGTLNNTSGFCVNGLTFAYGILLKMSNNPFQASRVHIVPGSIETENGRAYTRIEDCLLARRRRFFLDSDPETRDSTSDEDYSSSDESVMDSNNKEDDESSTDEESVELEKPRSAGQKFQKLKEELLQSWLQSIPGMKELAIEMTKPGSSPTATSASDRGIYVKRMLRTAYKLQVDEARSQLPLPEPKLVATQMQAARDFQPTTFAIDPDDVLSLSIELNKSKIGPFAFMQILANGMFDSAVAKSSSRITTGNASTTRGARSCKNTQAVFNCGLREFDPNSLPFIIPELVWDADNLNSIRLQNTYGCNNASISTEPGFGSGPSNSAPFGLVKGASDSESESAKLNTEPPQALRLGRPSQLIVIPASFYNKSTGNHRPLHTYGNIRTSEALIQTRMDDLLAVENLNPGPNSKSSDVDGQVFERVFVRLGENYAMCPACCIHRISESIALTKPAEVRNEYTSFLESEKRRAQPCPGPATNSLKLWQLKKKFKRAGRKFGRSQFIRSVLHEGGSDAGSNSDNSDSDDSSTQVEAKERELLLRAKIEEIEYTSSRLQQTGTIYSETTAFSLPPSSSESGNGFFFRIEQLSSGEFNTSKADRPHLDPIHGNRQHCQQHGNLDSQSRWQSLQLPSSLGTITHIQKNDRLVMNATQLLHSAVADLDRITRNPPRRSHNRHSKNSTFSTTSSTRIRSELVQIYYEFEKRNYKLSGRIMNAFSSLLKLQDTSMEESLESVGVDILVQLLQICTTLPYETIDGIWHPGYPTGALTAPFNSTADNPTVAMPLPEDNSTMTPPAHAQDLDDDSARAGETGRAVVEAVRERAKKFWSSRYQNNPDCLERTENGRVYLLIL